MRRLFAVLSLLLLFAAGCARDAITVDGEGISKEAFNLALKERLDAHKAMNLRVDEKAIRKSVSDELIAEALLLKEAKTRNIIISDEEVKKTVGAMRGNKSEKDFREDLKKSGMAYDIFLKRVKNRLTLSKLMTELVKDDSVTDQQLREFYNRSQVPFLKPEKEFVKIVQVNAEADAREATEKLKKGEDFDKFADEIAKSGKASSTDYGWLEPDTLSKEIGTAMKTAKINTVQGPYKGKDGSIYFFRIKERKASEVLPFDEAKSQIKNLLLNQKRQELAAHLAETQRKNAKVKINLKL